MNLGARCRNGRMRIGDKRLDTHCGSTGNFTWAAKITVAKWRINRWRVSY